MNARADPSVDARARGRSRIAPDAIRIAGAVRAALGDAERATMVVGAQPGDGVTTIVTQLGAALAAMTREPLLLIDANLRQPALHAALDIPAGPGLADFVHLDAALEDVVRTTALPHLFAVTAGHAGGPAPDALLHHERFARLLELARQRYRHVLVDAAPMIRYADWVAVAQHVDAAVLVLRAQRRTKAEAAEMTRLLQGLETKVLGAVLSHT